MDLEFPPAHVSSSCFFNLMKSSTFVDKTELLQFIYRPGSRMLITAPSKFGKTINMDMIKQFFSNQSNYQVHLITFENILELNIYKNKDFFRKHFQKHPVLYVCFKSGMMVKTYQDALNCYKSAFHNAFVEQSSLTEMPQLDENDKELITSWCCMTAGGYKNKQERDVLCDLCRLVELMYLVYNKPVIVLVDDYDSVVNKTIHETATTVTFRQVLDLTSALLKRLLRNNNATLFVVLTGVSCVTTAKLYDIDNLEIYPFLDGHQFVPYFGLTDDELTSLLSIEQFSEHSNNMAKIKEHYGGYISKHSLPLYNPFSITKFLNSGKFSFHWMLTDTIYKSITLSKDIAIRIHITHALEHTKVKLLGKNKVNLGDVLSLKNAFSPLSRNLKPNLTVLTNLNLALHHMIELGLLAYTDGDEERVLLKIPNTEVRIAIARQFQSYLIKLFQITNDYSRQDFYSFVDEMDLNGFPMWTTLCNFCLN